MDLQRTINKLNKIGREFEVKINAPKTKFMVGIRSQIAGEVLYINGRMVGKVGKFKYLD